MEVCVKQYVPQNAYVMRFRDKDEYENIMKKCPQYFNILNNICNDNVYSIYKSNQLIAITGWMPSIQNFCEIFFFACEDLDQKFDKSVLSAFKMILNKAKSGFERIQTTCKENSRNKRFLEFLGFKQECLMKKYGFNGEDMYQYALIKENHEKI
jgi:hypothetical protein